MGDGNLLSLRWNNHISNFKFTLGQLQQKDLYSDAMIACEGHFYPVHKFVLSTCSDYFASMFERTPCKHPVIVLKDVSVKDIEFLLSYMYGGEVSVGQTDLPSLIRAAETLNIKGLAAHDEPPASPQSSKKVAFGGGKDWEGNRSKRPRLETALNPERQGDDVKKEIEEDYTSLSETESEARNASKDENVTDLPFTSTEVNQVTTNDSNFYEESSFPELHVKQETEEGTSVGESSNSHDEGAGFNSSGQNPSSLVTPPDTEPMTWPSSFLSTNMSSSSLNNGLTGSSRSHRTNPQYPSRHSSSASDVGTSQPQNRSNHPPSSHPCPMCPKRFQSRADVIRHMRTHTGEKPFKCPHCDYRAALKGNLKSHILSRHSNLQQFT